MGSGGMSGKSSGLRKSQNNDQQNRNEIDDLFNNARVLSRSDVGGLQRDMNQTGFEAGDPNAYPRNKLYVNTSKAFNINYYLNTDGKSIDSPDSDWQNLGYTERMVKNDIAKIDSGMKPLTEDLKLVRWTSGKALGRMLGLSLDNRNISNLISKLESDNQSKTDFSNVLKSANYTQKSYTSASYKPTHSTFDDSPVRFNLVMRKGTNAIVTNNHAEAEVLGARSSKYNFTGGWRIEDITPTTRKARGRKMKQLVIDVYI